MKSIKDHGKQAFGRRLKDLIEKRGLKQYKLAEMIGIEPPNVTRWVKGDHFPSEEHLKDICRILDVPDSYFNVNSILNTQSRSEKIVAIMARLSTLDDSQLDRLTSLIETSFPARPVG